MLIDVSKRMAQKARRPFEEMLRCVLIVVAGMSSMTGFAPQDAIRNIEFRWAFGALSSANDGKLVRIPIPALTDERRKELSRHVHKQAEEGRNVVRQVRRDANERLKKLLKEHKISEDDERKGLDEVQKITDNHIKAIDELQKKKDQELLGK